MKLRNDEQENSYAAAEALYDIPSDAEKNVSSIVIKISPKLHKFIE